MEKSGEVDKTTEAHNWKKRAIRYGLASSSGLVLIGLSNAAVASADESSGSQDNVSEDGLSVSLEAGETVWSEAIDAGVASESIPELVRWLEDMDPDMPRVNMLPVNFTFTIPDYLLPQSMQPVALGTLTEPVSVVVEEGSSIYEELEDLSVSQPALYVDEVMHANSMASGDELRIQPGTELVIPAGIVVRQDMTIQSTVSDALPAKDEMQQQDDTAPSVMQESTSSSTESIAPSPVASEPVPTENSRIEVVSAPEISPVEEHGNAAEYIGESATVAYKIILDSLQQNNGILTPDAAAQAYVHVSQLPRHAEGDPEFPSPQDFVKLPAPSVEIPYVVHPNTCAEELYALPSTLLSTLMGIATHEWLLMHPENASKRDSIYELGDLVSGDHRTHGGGQASDHRSRIITSPPQVLPDGYAINTLSPNFDKEFTKSLLILQLLAKAPDGGYLLDHIEYYEPSIVKEVNAILFSMGRLDAPMVTVRGHSEHIHRKTRYIGNENTEAMAGPNTTSKCSYEYLTLDQATIDQIIARRSSYPGIQPTSLEAEAVVENVVVVDVAESTPINTETVTSSSYWLLDPNYKELVMSSDMKESRKEYFLTVTELVMKKYNEGAAIPPRATIAMAMWEGGYGEGKGVREGNNLFSHKVSREWAAENPDLVVWIVDDEFDDHGNEVASPFRKYPSFEASLDAHIELMTNSKYGQYEDSEKCRIEDYDFLVGLINELRSDCSIGRYKGETGVMSYATGDDYVNKLFGMITDSVISEIIVMNPDEAQRQATKEWVDRYAA